MSASAATRLRQLATQYHGGELDLQSYRSLRAELLDRLTNAEFDADESSTTLPQRTRPAAVPAPVTPAVVPPPPAPMLPAAPRKSAGGTLLSIGLAVAIGIGALWYFQLRPTPAATGASSEQVDTTSESYVAIDEFLAADDWSDDQIANFNIRWSTMPEEERAAALHQPWYQNFVLRVRSRVKEQRALTATANSAGTVRGPLFALASSVGIDVSSPDAIVPRVEQVGAADTGASREKKRATGAAPAISSPPAAQSRRTAAASPASPGAGVASAKPAATSRSTPADAGARTAAPQIVAESGNPDRCRVELVGSRKPRCRDALTIGGFGPHLALIPAGAFDMGNKDFAQEEPVHRVTIPRPFAIAEYEASQAEYRLFCTETRRSCEAQPWTGDDMPVVRVSWQDARDYVAWLSNVSGKNYRLATEAEWEYAARSGGGALYPSGEALSPTDAVFSHADKLTAPWPRSRRINANAFRLYHSIGNVREWVEDAWSANFSGAPVDGSAREMADTALRVARGGAYPDTAPKLRFTTREGLDAKTRDTLTGFRVVRDL
jgi:formylglycine-generating enzyme required for sulfatase activity